MINIGNVWGSRMDSYQAAQVTQIDDFLLHFELFLAQAAQALRINGFDCILNYFQSRSAK